MRYLTLIILFLTVNSYAEDILPCNGCNFESQYVELANDFYEDTGRLSVYMVDLQNKSIKKLKYALYHSDAVSVCNACSSTSSYMNAAQSIFNKNGSTRVSIVNFQLAEVVSLNRTLVISRSEQRPPTASYKWRVVDSPSELVNSAILSKDNKIRVWEEVVPEQYMVDVFHAELKRLEDNSFNLEKTILPDDAPWQSAWELYNNGAEQAAFNQYFSDEYAITYWSSALLSAYGGMAFSPLSGLELLIEFSDGTQITIVAPRSVSTSLSFSYIENSAVDVNGNKLPKKFELDGFEATFNEEYSMNEFFQNIENMGVNVEFVGISGSSVSSGATGRVSVEIIYPASNGSGGSPTAIVTVDQFQDKDSPN